MNAIWLFPGQLDGLAAAYDGAPIYSSEWSGGISRHLMADEGSIMSVLCSLQNEVGL